MRPGASAARIRQLLAAIDPLPFLIPVHFPLTALPSYTSSFSASPLQVTLVQLHPNLVI